MRALASLELAWATLHGLQTHPKRFGTPYRDAISLKYAMYAEDELQTCAAQAGTDRRAHSARHNMLTGAMLVPSSSVAIIVLTAVDVGSKAQNHESHGPNRLRNRQRELQRIKVCGCGDCKKKALYFTSSSTYRQRQGLGTMASMTALVATTTPHCKASHRVVVSQAQARSFTPALQRPARSAARPALRLNSPRNVKTYAQDTETAAGELLAS